MKLKAELSGDHHEVRLRREGSAVSAIVDDREYNLEILGVEAGEYLLHDDTNLYNCRVQGQLPNYLVHVNSRSYQITLADPKRLSASQGASAHHDGSAEIVASMPGKVVRILAEVGSQVEAGAGVMVVEAMKMQNEMKSPRSGTLMRLNAVPGATVNAGDVLAVIE